VDEYLAADAEPGQRGVEPSGPLIAMWPMRRPVLVPTPAAAISSSRQTVPSNSTSAVPRRRSAKAAVTAAQPGM
jgi:hypothetical protein